MNRDERLFLDSQSQRQQNASKWFVIFFAMIPFGLFMSIVSIYGRFDYNEYTDYLIAVFICVFATGLGGAVANILRWYDADNMVFDYGDDDEPPSSPTQYLEFEQAHEPPAMRLESNDGNTIRLGKTKPDIGTWADLAWALYADRWRWRRDGGVKDSGIFLSLSANFADITSDMVRVGFVEGGKHKTVTREGRLWFINQHPDLFLEHMR